jgi:hypothetical protein
MALKHLVSQYRKFTRSFTGLVFMRQEYNSDADSYKPFGDTTQRYARVKAKEICEKVIAQKDSSEGKINCINLLKQIEAKELNLVWRK